MEGVVIMLFSLMLFQILSYGFCAFVFVSLFDFSSS